MRIGIDLGGTKIEGIALTDGGEVAERRRVTTPRDYDGSVEAIAALVETIERAVGARCSVGVGIPGALTAEGLVKNANSTWLIGRPLGRDLEIRLSRPVRLMNDANCFAISEAADGAGAGADVVFGVILGTGSAAVSSCTESVSAARTASPANGGTIPCPGCRPMNIPARRCYCGKRGCVETFLSGPGFERDFVERAAVAMEPAGNRCSRRRRATSAAQRRFAIHDRLARALASVINVLDPDVVVLGGGMSNLPDLAESTSALLPRYVFSNSVKTRIALNVHGDSSGVRGAAWLWPREDAGRLGDVRDSRSGQPPVS